MGTTYADLENAKRHEITVKFVSQRVVDCDGERVHRLLVTDQSGEQFSILTTPDSGAFADLQTGTNYRVSGLLGVIPATVADKTNHKCPNCRGPLRPGHTIDSAGSAVPQAVSQLSLDQPFGISDAVTTIHRSERTQSAVDDWVPVNRESSVIQPDYACEFCGNHVDSNEVEHPNEVDEITENIVLNDSLSEVSNPQWNSPETVGLATGGAKDAASFRENIKNGYTPQPEAISDEGLFYDYYFQTGTQSQSNALFTPRCATAVSDHPISGETEYYLSVGLDSTLSIDEFERPQLDLVVVLDVSGSMDSPFDEYYYDEHGRKRKGETAAETKLEAATQSLCALTEQLHEDDRLGVVLFNHRAHVAKPLRDVKTTDMPAIRRHIREIAAGGSTNLADGFEAAVDMLIDQSSTPAVERRVVFMTDMMPNTGTTSESELTELITHAASEDIHTTFIGMGVDANAELTAALSGIRGANHYFIHSAAEFDQRLNEEFDYMVTPVVHELTLGLETDGYEVKAVHGSPSKDTATEHLMDIGTLFPSAKQDAKARGGVVLIQLERTKPKADAELVASWVERDGGEHTERIDADIPDESEVYGHSGVRKAVALTRYARELRSWAKALHDRAEETTGVDDWLLPDQRGPHERESVPLSVPNKYAERFDCLHRYLTSEISSLGDETLHQETQLLETLCQQAPAPTGGGSN